MAEEKESLKKEEMPKTLEELFVKEYYSVKAEVENSQMMYEDSQAMLERAKRTITSLSKELKTIKEFIATYADPIELDEDGYVSCGRICLRFGCDHWDLREYPERREILEYLKTIIPIVPKEEEKKEEESEGGRA